MFLIVCLIYSYGDIDLRLVAVSSHFLNLLDIVVFVFCTYTLIYVILYVR